MRKYMAILRGISGAGKSTKATALADDLRPGESAAICSADRFFMRDGVYHFDASQLGAAHGACMRDAIHACSLAVSVVVIDNTNITAVEVAPYALLAQAYGYECEVITLAADPFAAAKRAVHGLDAHRILRMADQLDEETPRLAPWWTQRVEYEVTATQTICLGQRPDSEFVRREKRERYDELEARGWRLRAQGMEGWWFERPWRKCIDRQCTACVEPFRGTEDEV